MAVKEFILKQGKISHNLNLYRFIKDDKKSIEQNETALSGTGQPFNTNL